MMQISSVLMVKKKAVTNMAMKIGYIQEIDLQLNPQCKERFRFKEANIMKKNSKIILVREPFLLDDELRKKVTEWVEWANTADPHEYDPFA